MTIERLVEVKDLLEKSQARVKYYLQDLADEDQKRPFDQFLFYSRNWHLTRIQTAKLVSQRIHNYYRKSLVKFIETQLK